jgi:hypothetical protein
LISYASGFGTGSGVTEVASTRKALLITQPDHMPPDLELEYFDSGIFSGFAAVGKSTLAHRMGRTGLERKGLTK